MAQDCCSPRALEAPNSCPVCGQPGQAVPTATLDALDLSGCEHGGDSWRFCGSPACDVVWFGERTRQWVARSEVRVRVGAKEDLPDRPVCYCFGYDARSIEQAPGSQPRISAAIRDRCRRGEAQCETENPRGRCCLRDVLAIERS